MALKILLAEDEEALSRVYKAALEHQGYEVDQAFNGQEAVDLAAQNAYQVMIMDIMMPIKTGIEALKEIRSSGDRTHVIMLTAMAEIDDRVTGLDAGADDYLTKPISLKELLARLRSLERRVSESFTAKILTLGSVRLDQEEQELDVYKRQMLAKGTYKNINGNYTNKEVPFGFVFDKHLFLDNQEIKSTINRSPNELALTVNNESKEAKILSLPVFYYKGQEARIDGKRVTTYLAKEKNPTNLVLPPGKHGVVLTYSYTPVAKLAMGVSTISLLAFIGYLYRVKKDD